MKQGNAIGVFVRSLKANFPEPANLLIYSSMFIGFSCCLVKGFIDRKPTIEMTSLLVWTLVGISGTIENWLNMMAKESEIKPDIITKSPIFSQQWRSQILSIIVFIILLCLPVVLIFIVNFPGEASTKSYIASNIRFELLGDWAMIFVGLGIILQTITTIFNIQQYLLKKILNISSAIAILTGGILSILSLIHAANFAKIN